MLSQMTALNYWIINFRKYVGHILHEKNSEKNGEIPLTDFMQVSKFKYPLFEFRITADSSHDALLNLPLWTFVSYVAHSALEHELWNMNVDATFMQTWSYEEHVSMILLQLAEFECCNSFFVAPFTFYGILCCSLHAICLTTVNWSKVWCAPFMKIWS